LTAVNTTDIASKFTQLATSLQPASDQIVNAGASFAKVGEGANEAVIRIELVYVAIEKSVANFNTLAETLNNRVVPALSAFDQGQQSNVASIDNTITALNNLKAKYEEVADAASRANAAGGGGGAGEPSVNVGSNRLGGTSTSPGEVVSRPMSLFNGAAQLASGIANTNRLTKTDGKGGIPTILHPNEAVIPLTSGGKVPVQLSSGNAAQQASQPVIRPEIFISPFQNLINQDSGKGSAPGDTVSAGVEAALNKMSSFFAAYPSPHAIGSTGILSPVARQKESAAETTRGTGTSTTNTSTDNSRQQIVIKIEASDFDSFKRSAGQIDTEMFKRTRKAFLRNG
jgi:hypothetical protein